MFIHRLIILSTCFWVLTGCAGAGPDAPSSFIERPPGDGFQLRVMTWNVKLGSIFPPDGRRHAGFARIVRAVDPDLLILQEVDPREADRLAKLMDRIRPLGHSRVWQIHGGADNAIISRYPLRQRASERVVPYPLPNYPNFQYGQGMALVDVPDGESAVDVYIIAMHNRSRAGDENIRQRQVQSDAVVRWLRQLKEARSIPVGTPIIVAGDMNVLPGAPANHLATLLTGDIADEQAFGPDIRPDWDGTDLRDASPSHNAEGREFYTWRDDSQPYPPGQLSRILYTDSVLLQTHGFVVNTVEMAGDELEQYGLLRTDSLLDGEQGLFDHMPVVADFTINE